MKRILLILLFLATSRVAFAQQKLVLSAAATSCTVSNASCLVNSVDPVTGGATFTVSANGGGNTLQFEASGDGGTTWVALNATPSNGTTVASSTSSTGTWQTNVAAYTNVRIRMSTLVNGTSTVSIIFSSASARAMGGGGAAGSGTVTGSAGQSALFTATNTVSGGTVVLDMAGIAGADLGAKMNNCATALPAAGGTCKGDNLTGALTLSTAVTTAKPVVYTFCGQTISQTANIALAHASSSVVGCPGANTTFTKAANIDQFTLTGEAVVVDGITLLGVSGSFTGNGITASSANAQTGIRNNIISGEAAQAVSGNGFVTLTNNLILGVSGVVPVLGSAIVQNNTIDSTNADAVDVNFNQAVVAFNFIAITLSGVSGMCGINVTGDVLLVNVNNNFVNLNDTGGPGTDFNYGVCETTTVGSNHMFNNIISDNSFTALLAGGNEADGYYYNNANDETTEASGNRWTNNSCVHENPACLKWTDPTSQLNIYENFGFNLALYDTANSTGGTGNVYKQSIGGFTFATLPAKAGDDSRVVCSDCVPGAPISAGGGVSSIIQRSGGVWVPVTKSYFTAIDSAYTNSTMTPSNLIAIPVAPNVHYAGYCILFYEAAATGGLVVSWTQPASSFYLFTGLSEPLSASTTNYQSGFSGGAQGVLVTTPNTFFPARVDFSMRNGGNAGTLQLLAASTAAATLTIQEGSYCMVNQE